ncbi:MAG: RNA polymerase factor sigma-54 [Alphaproteobacteria bacterium]
MSLTPQLRLKQKQSLKLTQTMRQSIEVMQLDRDEIEALIQQEKEENPLIELDSDYGVVDVDADTSRDKDVAESLSTADVADNLDTDQDYNNEYDEERHSYYQPSTTPDAGSIIEATAAFSESVYEQISNQIRLSIKNPRARAIAQFWLSQLDENGRLSITAFNHAKNHGLSDDDLEFLLGRLQQFDPVGIFARNIIECFKAQLIDSEEWDLLWLDIFDNMDKILAGQLPALQQLLQLTDTVFQGRMKRLKSLYPHPNWQNETTIAHIIIAELKVYRANSGALQIELNENAFSNIVMHAVETQASLTLKQNDWIKAKRDKGRFLTKILARRAESILKLGEVILQKQVMFFEKDARYLAPLTMGIVAEELGVHESTVSRLVRGKYLEYMGQTIELRWFFQAGKIHSQMGGDLSAISVQEHIKSIIENETHKKPYSDDALVTVLNSQYGLKIARRTISKYREMANIPSSVQRKKQYRLSL